MKNATNKRVITVGERFVVRAHERQDPDSFSVHEVVLVQYGHGQIRVICAESYNRIADIDIPRQLQPVWGCKVEDIEQSLGADGTCIYKVK